MNDARTVRPGEAVRYHNEPSATAPKAKLTALEVERGFVALTDEQRVEIMSECCRECGSLALPCAACNDD